MTVKSTVLFFLLFLGGMLWAADLNGRAGNLNGRLADILSGEEFDGASVSILALTAAGDTLLCADAHRQLIPASNLKLVTTALALHALGPDYHYRTSIGHTGTVTDGILHGDLYIIGGGDPTLGSHNRIAEPLDSVFARWLGFVRAAGIERIDGYVIGDGRFFPGMMEQESWQLNDSGTYYGSGVSGLSFYENELDFRVAPGAAEGDPLDISPVWPELPWMTFSYACSTGPADGRNTLYFYTSGFAPYGQMRGRLASDRKPRTEAAANKFPEYTVASYFFDYLQENGVTCTMRPADLGPVFSPQERSFSAPDAGSLSVIGSTESPSLGRIVGVTNRDSNNMYAETLMKTLGREIAGEGTYEGAYRAEAGLLAMLGGSRSSAFDNPDVGKASGGLTDVEKVVIRDGSGLSREDHVSAAFLCSLLRAMMDSPAGPAFVGSLPWPGSEGTLASVLKAVPTSERPRLRMKSGSMGGVRCFSGYILPSDDQTDDDTVLFSILVNNYGVPTYKIQRKIEEIILLLTE